MPGALLKLLVKDKLLHNRKVPVNAKERQLRPLRRERRLQRLSTNQRERFAVQPPEEIELRLEQMSTNQRERLAVENPDERETRLQHMRKTGS